MVAATSTGLPNELGQAQQTPPMLTNSKQQAAAFSGMFSTMDEANFFVSLDKSSVRGDFW